MGVEEGTMLALDGGVGEVIVAPTDKEVDLLKERSRRRALALAGSTGKGATYDGYPVKLLANIGTVDDAMKASKFDLEGSGLFRTEFLFLERSEAPTLEEQTDTYTKVLQAFGSRRVVVRTLDAGADKPLSFADLGAEENPALGYRAIRICLTRKDFFKTQLRALLRASAYGNMSIMFPMITSLRELQDAKAVLDECRAELRAEGKKFDEKIEVGTMIETPAAVLIADELAEECDFFSIGTNDLTQYTCALDRQNAKLEPFFNPHHPAVLRAIKMTIDAGHRHGIWVGICGELGADTALTETFLRMGVDELSMNAKSVLPVRKIIRSIDLSKPSDK